jgi:uncharacterized protein YlxW (UPF0749 family)
MSQQLSLAVMAICMLVITLAILVVSIVSVMLIMRVRKSVTSVTNRAQPLISQATETVKTANSVAQNVKAHADRIMDRAEDTVDSVTRKVKTTSNVIQESVNPSVITVASVLTGVSRGLEVWSQVRRRGGNGHAGA